MSNSQGTAASRANDSNWVWGVWGVNPGAGLSKPTSPCGGPSQLMGHYPRVGSDLPASPSLLRIHISRQSICIRMSEAKAVKSDTVRTNIVLDSKLIEVGLKATGLKTRRELVDFALRELLRHEQQKELLSLKGKLTWEGDLGEMRTGRGQ